MTIDMRIQMHKEFWNGKGPSLILIPPGRDMRETWQVQIYDTSDYEERFYNPEEMWKNEMQRAKPVIDWPTDGIPTIRPNLGVIFIPAMTGQKYEIRPGQMPWCKEPLTKEQIIAAKDIDVSQTQLMRLAEGFYKVHAEKGTDKIKPYHPDTQGIFDVAHLLYGEQILYDIIDSRQSSWMDELLDISMELMVRATRHVKKLLNEPATEMFHGHGTEQGVFFVDAGIRISEDAPTMVSPEMIDRFVMERIERCGELFGGVFMHYCGKHDYFYERLCASAVVKAIDLGNPEAYDTHWLLETCAKTGTVFYGRLNSQEGEDWPDYITRLASIVKKTGVRCILRPLVFPKDRKTCEQMLQMWHELTS